MKRGPCALCLETRPLRRSHLLPEFFYAPLYDNNGQLRRLNALPILDDKMRKGFWEHILCGECEGFLNREYETPFKRYWFDEKALEVAKARAVASRAPADWLRGFDYATFKLMNLSVIWRGHVAQRQYGEKCDIGPHAEIIRQMIRTKDAGDIYRYPLTANGLLNMNGSIAYGAIGQPVMSRVECYDVVTLAYGGCEWAFILAPDTRFMMNDIHDAYPQIDGSMFVTFRPFVASNTFKAFNQQRKENRGKPRPRSK